jgi:Ni/Fe-hydrogenase 1 B-type cytochrome subunit
MSHYETLEEHPLPAVVMHWVHLLSFFALIITGLLIHQPVNGIDMGVVRNIHFIVMFVFMLNVVVRVYWAFMGMGSADHDSVRLKRDWKWFVYEQTNKGTFWPSLKYYLFLQKERPYTSKYNPLQKLTYGTVFPLLAVVMAVTGFAMWTPSAAYFAWLTDILGGQNGVRLIHYFSMWIFIVLFMVHLYLVFFEDLKELWLMLFYWVPEKYRDPKFSYGRKPVEKADRAADAARRA